MQTVEGAIGIFRCTDFVVTESSLSCSAPAPPRLKDDDVKQLQEMFPTIDREVIVSVLQASGARMDSAVTNLLAMTNTDT